MNGDPLAEKSDPEKRYERLFRQNAMFMGWGFFSLFVSIPLTILAAFVIGSIAFVAFSIFMFVLLIAILGMGVRITMIKTDFWLEYDLALDILGAIDIMLVGAIISLGSMMAVLHYLFGTDPLIPDTFAALALFAGLIVFFHMMFGYMRKKHGGARVRNFRSIEQEGLESIIARALDSLRLDCTRGQEGSRWFVLRTVFNVEPLIKIEVFLGRGLTASIRPASEEGIVMARRIEKAIDAALANAPA